MSVHLPVSVGLLAQDRLELCLEALKVLDLEPEGSQELIELGKVNSTVVRVVNHPEAQARELICKHGAASRSL